MAFFMWNQNNSGGVFDVTDDVTWRVVIEAENYDLAEYKALNLGIYYNGCDDGRDCDCCGDRWYDGEELDTKGDPMLEVLQKYADEWGCESPSIIIHYADGTKGTIERKVNK